MLHPDRTASGNGKWLPPPEPEATPLPGRGQHDGRVRWVEDFFGLEALHTER